MASSNSPQLDFQQSPQHYDELRLEGQMTAAGGDTRVVTSGAQNLRAPPGAMNATLDEPIFLTFKRDAIAIFRKLLHVLYPTENKLLLREWDLWGPFFLCVILAALMHSTSDTDPKSFAGASFAQIFVLFWLGAFVVTLNTKLLGGALTYLQSLCVLGYCALPLLLALLLNRLLGLLLSAPSAAAATSAPISIRDGFLAQSILYIRFLIALAAVIWSTFASTAFLVESEQQIRAKKPLVIYPVFLFYCFLGLIVLTQ
jgi:hypothetical protein